MRPFVHLGQQGRSDRIRGAYLAKPTISMRKHQIDPLGSRPDAL